MFVTILGILYICSASDQHIVSSTNVNFLTYDSLTFL